VIREHQEQRERRCPFCGQGTLVARVIRDEFEYGPEDDRITIVAEGVPVLECPACGETLYGPDAARVRHQAICRALGLLTPEQIKGVREELGKKQSEFAELTGIGVATLSRWEQGRLIQTRALDRYLRLLQWEENVQRLRDLEEGTNGMSPTPLATREAAFTTGDTSNKEKNRCLFFNNCRARDHVALYGADAFYDLDDWGAQADMARDIEIGQECVVATPVPGTKGTEIEFNHFRLSRVTREPNPTDPQRRVCRVFRGDFVRSVRHPKAVAAKTQPYSRFFNRLGHFKRPSVV
jgi:putative zinc finger/helix-turn-helix YgiT family protein